MVKSADIVPLGRRVHSGGLFLPGRAFINIHAGLSEPITLFCDRNLFLKEGKTEMTIRNFIGAVCLAAVLFPAGRAAAESVPADAVNPYLQEMEERTRELGEALSPEALKHLYYIREGFGATRVVSIVRKDIENAVKACGKANPDLKDGMNGAFADWTSAVDPVVKEKKALMDQAINKQDYAKPKEIRDYLQLIEKAGDYANKQIDKQIVTTPEACNSLKESMNETRAVVVRLLGDVQFLVWPIPGSETGEGQVQTKAEGE